MKKLLVVIFTVLAVFTLSACDRDEENTYNNISNAELTEMLESEDEYQFIDVRTLTEYNEAHIPGFDINIDYYQLKEDYSMIAHLDKDIPVVIMCRSGNRSVSAALIFIEEGFEEVYNLENGINGWNGETE